jgi:cobyrinic acid a,c-diamide synthase
MTGVIPVATTMTERVTIGYRELVALADSPLAVAGQRLRGHEFHYSALVPRDGVAVRPAYSGGHGVLAGPRDNVLGSYVHVHLSSDPRLADRLIASARIDNA